MRIWIICSGGKRARLPGRCTLSEYAALRQGELDGEAMLDGAAAVAANGRKLYVSPRACAAETAARLVTGAEGVIEPLLDEPEPAVRGDRTLPTWLCRLTAWLYGILGAGKKECRDRAAMFADRLESEGGNAIIISHPRTIAALIDVLRVRGYCVQRTGIGRIKPPEQMLLSMRDEHCGGCAHNCLLSNPGCNIGRDKAARHSA